MLRDKLLARAAELRELIRHAQTKEEEINLSLELLSIYGLLLNEEET